MERPSSLMVKLRLLGSSLVHLLFVLQFLNEFIRKLITKAIEIGIMLLLIRYMQHLMLKVRHKGALGGMP